MRRSKPPLPGSTTSVNVSRRSPVMGSMCSNGSWLKNSRFALNPRASKVGSLSVHEALASEPTNSARTPLRIQGRARERRIDRRA
jgi:hypothetical protein